METLEQGSAADEDFRVILENLDKASEYRVAVDDEGAFLAIQD